MGRGFNGWFEYFGRANKFNAYRFSGEYNVLLGKNNQWNCTMHAYNDRGFNNSNGESTLYCAHFNNRNFNYL